MEFKKIALSILLSGLVGSHVLAMDVPYESAATTDQVMDEAPEQALEDATNQVTDPTFAESRRSHDRMDYGYKKAGAIEFDAKKAKIDSQPQICTNGFQVNCLTLIFEFATGGVNVERDPIENFIALKKLCKLILPVCRTWRTGVLELIKFDLNGLMNSLRMLDSETQLVNVFLAKRVLDSLKRFDVNGYFNEVEQRVFREYSQLITGESILARVLSDESFLVVKSENSGLLCGLVKFAQINRLKVMAILGVKLRGRDFGARSLRGVSNETSLRDLSIGDGTSLRDLSIECDKPEALKTILRLWKANREGLQVGKKSRPLGLLHSVIMKYPEKVKMVLQVLVELRLDLNEVDIHEDTPLHIAIEKKDSLVAKALVEAGVLVDEADLEKLSSMGIDISKIRYEQIVRK